MKVIKQIVAAVWPTIYNVLDRAAGNTQSKVDDIMIEAVNAAVKEWIQSTVDED